MPELSALQAGPPDRAGPRWSITQNRTAPGPGHPRPGSDSEDGVWALGQKDGPPRIISRWRSDLRAPDPKRPVRVTIGVMFRETRPRGMPATSAENDFLYTVEEALVAELPAHGAVLALVVTGEGNREWIAYAASHEWLADWAPGFASRFLEERTREINAQADPEWSTYLAFSVPSGTLPASC